MKFLLNAALIGLSLTGCIVYDEELTYDENLERGDRPTTTQGDTTANSAPEISLNPNQGSVGEVVLVSLLTDENSNVSDITEINFYGNSDLLVVAEQERNDQEVILAIDIAGNSDIGSNHILVEFADGAEVFLSDAFEVLD